MTAVPPEHPMAQTLARVRLLNDYLKPELGVPSGDGWIAASDAFRSDTPLLERLVAATQARLRTKAAAIVGSAILQSYQWPLVSTAVACSLLDRRVPDLRAANVLVHYNAEHEADALALIGGRFTALPDDPAVDHPEATVVPDQEALHTALRTGLEAHLGTTIAQLCTRLGCKPRGLWLNVADSLAGTLTWLMQEHDPGATMAQIEAEVAALIRVPGSPLTSRQIGLLQISNQERTQVFLDRATCCYWYKTDGGEYCSTCPHRTPEDRRERLLGYMAESHAEHAGAAQAEVAS